MKKVDILLFITSLVLMTSVSFSQSKVNTNTLVQYGDKMYKINDDKPYTGKVFDLHKSNGNKKMEGLSSAPPSEDDTYNSYGGISGLYNTDKFGKEEEEETEKYVKNNQGGYGDIDNGYGKDSYDESGYEGGEDNVKREAESKSQFTGAIKVIAGISVVILALTFFRPSGQKSRILNNTPIKTM